MWLMTAWSIQRASAAKYASFDSVLLSQWLTGYTPVDNPKPLALSQ